MRPRKPLAILIIVPLLLGTTLSTLGGPVSADYGDIGTVTTTSTGSVEEYLEWSEEDAGTARTVDLTLNTQWQVQSGRITLSASPVILDEGTAYERLSYPEPEVDVGGDGSDWRFDSPLGHQILFDADKESLLAGLSSGEEEGFTITLPAGSTITDIRLTAGYDQGKPYDLDLFIGDQPGSVWHRDSFVLEDAVSIDLGKGITDVCTGHMDPLLDKHADIVAISDDGTITVLLHDPGQAAGYNRSEISPFGGEPDPPSLLACSVGDLDQDNDDDIAVTTSDGRLLYFENQGHGTFASPIVVKVAPNRLESISMGDVSEDGWRDLAVGYVTGSVFVLIYDNNTPGFQAPVEVQVNSHPISDVAIVDLEGDGRGDLVCAGSSGTIWVVRSMVGGWDIPFPVTVGGSALTSLAVADLDNDAFPDIISADVDGTLFYSMSEGGTFDGHTDLAGCSGILRDVAAGDLDLDGDVDIAGLCSDGRITVYGNAGSLEAGRAKAAVGVDTRALALTDLDNDGDPDGILGTGSGVDIWYNGQGPFVEVLGKDDGGLLRSGVQSWLDSNSPDPSSYEDQGHELMAVPLRLVSRYPANIVLKDLEVTYDLAITLDITEELGLYLSKSSKLAEPDGRISVPIHIASATAGRLHVEQIEVVYKEMFMVAISSPEHGTTVYDNQSVALACNNNADQEGTSTDFGYEWSVDTRHLGDEADMTIRGRDLGGHAYHRLTCRVTRISTGEVSSTTILVKLEPNLQPVFEHVPEKERATVDEEMHVLVTGYDPDPWDAVNLTFSLMAAPVGMRIEPRTGLLSWMPSKHDIGLHPVVVGLSDGKEIVNASFNIVVRAAPAAVGVAEVIYDNLWLVALTIGLAAVGVVVAGTEVGIFAFYAFLFFLYTRLKQERVLDNFVRGRVYGHICEHPGIHFSDLKRKLDLPNGTLTYHLKTLEREGLIQSFPNGTNRVFFSSKVKVPKDLIKLTKAQRMVLDVIRAGPGMSQKAIVKETGLSSSSVSRIVLELEEKGHIRVDKGRKSTCYLKET